MAGGVESPFIFEVKLEAFLFSERKAVHAEHAVSSASAKSAE